MDTTGWYLKDTRYPIDVLHAHPLSIVKTEAEATARGISRWHTAREPHADATLHAYYNAFNPSSTRWHADNKGDARKGIIANLTEAQRAQIILNAQAAHNNTPFPPVPAKSEPQAQEPLRSHFSDSDTPPVPATPEPVIPEPVLPKPTNGTPSATQLDALTALIEEQAKMSALGLRANVETRQSLNAHISSTDREVIALRQALTASEQKYQELAQNANSLAARLAVIEAAKPQEVKITYVRKDGSNYAPNGRTHRAFPTLLKIMESFPYGERNVYMYGPAGVGKTHMAQELAKALGVPLYVTGSVAAKHELLGYMNAAGEFVPTQFHTAMTSGGVFLFDEIDGSFPNALLSVQNALANKFVVFPNSAEPVPVHENTYLICAANTDGSGADAQYASRQKQDGAFMDRFQVMHVDYDDDFEVSRVPAEYVSWAKAVIACRHNARSATRDPRSGQVQGASANVIISQRAIWRGVRLLQSGHFSPTEVAEMAFPQYQKLNTYSTIFAPIIEWAKEAEKSAS